MKGLDKEHTDSDERVEGMVGERRGRVIKEHVYKGPMDKDNRGAGLDVEA